MNQIAGKNVIREYDENKVVEFQTLKGLEKRRIKYHICVLEGGTIAAYKVFNSDELIDERK
ncbi:MAG: hypothetical protein WC549_04720 [Actinomycetota bacterium]